MSLRAALPGLLLASCLTAEDVHGSPIRNDVEEQADAGGQAERFPFTGRALAIDGQPLRHFRINGVDVVSRDGRFSVLPECTRGNRLIVLSAEGHAPTGAAIDCDDPNRELGDVMLPKGRKLTVDCVDATTRRHIECSQGRSCWPGLPRVPRELRFAMGQELHRMNGKMGQTGVRFENLPINMDLWVNARGRGEKRVVAGTADSELELAFEEGARLRLPRRDGARPALWNPDTMSEWTEPFWGVDYDPFPGETVFDDLAPGRYLVVSKESPAAIVFARPVTVGPGVDRKLHEAREKGRVKVRLARRDRDTGWTLIRSTADLRRTSPVFLSKLLRSFGVRGEASLRVAPGPAWLLAWGDSPDDAPRYLLRKVEIPDTPGEEHLLRLSPRDVVTLPRTEQGATGYDCR